MRSISKQTVTVAAERGALELSYAILVEESLGAEVYGISVAARPGGGRDHIRGITPSAERIAELFALFVRNAVTPTEARYVTRDWLADG